MAHEAARSERGWGILRRLEEEAIPLSVCCRYNFFFSRDSFPRQLRDFSANCRSSFWASIFHNRMGTVEYSALGLD